MQGEPRSGGWRATPSSAPSRLAKPGRIELQVLAVLRVLLNDVSSFQLWLCKFRIYNKHTRKPISQTYVGAFCEPPWSRTSFWHTLFVILRMLLIFFGPFHDKEGSTKSDALVLVPAKVSVFLDLVEVRVFPMPGPRGWVNNCGVCISRGIQDLGIFSICYVVCWYGKRTRSRYNMLE